MSLTVKYQQLNELYNRLDNFTGYGASKDDKYQQDVFLALDTVSYLEKKVEELDLFEKNFFDTLKKKKNNNNDIDSKEKRVKGNLSEIDSNLLFFFNLNFFKAMLISKIKLDPKVLEQLGSTYYVKKSLDALILFLEICESYGLIFENELEMIYSNLSKSDYYEKEDQSGRKKVIQKPVDRRMVKIERQKKQIELKKKIEALLKKKTEFALKKEKFIGKEEEIEDIDYEKEERELILNEIQYNAVRALDEVDVLIQELDMLETMEKMKQGQIKLRPQKPKEPIGNFVLLGSKREELKKGVFKVPYNLPTYSIEEWAEMEMEKGTLPMQPSQKQNELEKKQKDEQKKIRDKTEEEEEQKRQKKIEWDEFRDSVQKGQGNKNDNYFKRN